MKWSKSYLFTLKDAPQDAEIPSHQLMSRGGYIRKLAPGIYTYGHLALRAIRKFEAIVREELDKRGCQELLMPMVQPQALWEETGRWAAMGDGLLKFKNRNGHGFCLGATHEEVITDYVRKDVKSYRDLPAILYQIQTKYRDELRPRFGLMRGREFIMKDAYSFDTSPEAALKSYTLLYDAYKAIFTRLGLDFRIVEADAGNIGGSQTHEFQVLAETGEDHLMVCDTCDFAANIEVAPALSATPAGVPSALLPMESFATPGLKTILDLSKSLKIPENQLVKTLFYSAQEPGSEAAKRDLKPIAVLLRGSDELNPVKLKNVLGLVNAPLMLTDDEVRMVTGAGPGSCGPVGLKIPIYVDQAVTHLQNFIVGANRDDQHLKNVNLRRDFNPTQMVDLRMARAGDPCPKCKGHYQSHRGIEVGHVFYLGTKYSKAMNATFLNQEGQSLPIEMGCYGIGISRTVQAAVEQSHDKDGIIWPPSIAPFLLHMCVLDPQDPAIRSWADKTYAELQAAGISVLMDDREERPGVKFKDADLLGMPLRLNLGKRGFDSGELEIVVRKSKEIKKIKLDSAVSEIRAWATSAGV